jgi:hypothetical protein
VSAQDTPISFTKTLWSGKRTHARQNGRRYASEIMQTVNGKMWDQKQSMRKNVNARRRGGRGYASRRRQSVSNRICNEKPSARRNVNERY